MSRRPSPGSSTCHNRTDPPGLLMLKLTERRTRAYLSPAHLQLLRATLCDRPPLTEECPLSGARRTTFAPVHAPNPAAFHRANARSPTLRYPVAPIPKAL